MTCTAALRSEAADLAAVTDGANGRVVDATPAFEALGPVSSVPLGFSEVRLEDREYRVLAHRLADGRGLVVARSNVQDNKRLGRLRRLLFLGGGIALLVVPFVLALVLRRSLAPVHRTAAVAAAIVDDRDLARRIEVPDGDDEIVQLVTSVNAMLERLEASQTSLRRFAADAAHELRTPLTTLRGNVEQLLDARGMSDQDRTEALRGSHEEIVRIQRLAEDLLALARSDGPTLRRDRVPLSDLLPDCASDIVVLGDSDALRRMFANLVENGERYGGSVAVTVRRTQGRAEVRIIDHGPGVPEAEREAIFERFARADATMPGSGLGLAIARTTARAHGGEIVYETTPGGGATFVVSLPLAAGPAADPPDGETPTAGADPRPAWHSAN